MESNPAEKIELIKAQRTAFNLLARREHSAFELIQKLKLRGYSQIIINTVLNKLQQQKLQSDTRFAENYVHARVNKGYGPLRIQQELQQRGITSELINDALGVYNNWQEYVEQVRQKRFGAKLPKDFSKRAKQIRFLQYRGFATEHITLIFKNTSYYHDDE